MCTGDIYTTGLLDRETQSNYTINISASDHGVIPHPLEASTLLTITLLDFNDNAPVLSSDNQEFTIPEEEVEGRYVGQVQASDLDEGENGEVFFKMVDSSPFEIDESGSIKTTKVLDREVQASYTLNIVAQDKGRLFRTTAAKVTIHVSDINDHAPVFEQDVYAVNILEKSPVSAVILFAKASDSDAGLNADITYSLLARNNNAATRYFNIDPNTGLLTIAKVIDRSVLVKLGILEGYTDTTLELTLQAEDWGQPPLVGQATVYVNIDEINDDSPQFLNSTYWVEVLEELSEGNSDADRENWNDGIIINEFVQDLDKHSEI